MSRESSEQNALNQYLDNFPKGRGDVDFYGNPAEVVLVRHVRPPVMIHDVRPVTKEQLTADVPF